MDKGLLIGCAMVILSSAWIALGWVPARDFMYLTLLLYIVSELDRIATALQRQRGNEPHRRQKNE